MYWLENIMFKCEIDTSFSDASITALKKLWEVGSGNYLSS